MTDDTSTTSLSSHNGVLTQEPVVTLVNPATSQPTNETVTPAHAPQRIWEKMQSWPAIAYAMGCIIEAGVIPSMAFYSNIFLLNVVMLSPFTVAPMLFVVRIFDAVMDPVIGFISDNTRSRYGRRRLFIMQAFFPLIIVYPMLWIPLAPTSEAGVAFYYVVLYIVFETFLSFYKINYDSLTSEMAYEYHDSTNLVVKKTLFYIVTTIIVTVATAQYASSSDPYVFLWMSFVVIGCTAPFSIVMIFNIRERRPTHTIWETDEWKAMNMSSINLSERLSSDRIGPISDSQLTGDDASDIDDEGLVFPTRNGPSKVATVRFFFRSLLAEYADVMKDAEYIKLCITNLLIWVVINVMQSTLMLYIRYVLRRPAEYFVDAIMHVQAGVVLGILIIMALEKVAPFDKKRMLQLTLLLWIFVFVNMLTKEENAAHEIVYGVCIAWAMLMTQSMLPNVIDGAQSRHVHRKRSDAMYYSFFSVFQKLGIAISLGAVNLALGVAGYDPSRPSEEMDAKVAQIMNGVFIAFPLCSLTLALIPLSMYKITRERHMQIQETLNTYQ